MTTSETLIADVRGCTLGWFDYELGNALANTITASVNPAEVARDISNILTKLAAHIEDGQLAGRYQDND